MTRFVPVTVLLVVLAASRIAGAQASGDGSGSLPDGSTINFDKLYIHENGNPDLAEPETNPDSLWNYFNFAHCKCAKAPPDGFVEDQFGFLLTLTGQVTPNPQTLEIWVGPSCNGDDTQRRASCSQIEGANVQPISSIASSNGVTREVSLFKAMTPGPTETDCIARMQDATVWAIADSNADGTRDFFVSKVIHTDSQAPLLPSGFRAVGGDGAIQISWNAPIDTADTYAYQALCAVADTDLPAKTTNLPTRRYQTAATLCGGDGIDLGAGSAIPAQAGVDAQPVTALPDGLKNLDPKFLCGENFSATATSLRIDGLANGTAYKVLLLAVDKFQNPVGTFFTSTVTPIPSTDFWEDLQERNSKVEGGLCLLAETYGDDSSLTGALRAFRDDTLRGSGAGRWLSDAYYATLGKLGGLVHGSIIRRVIAGVVLAPVVALALAWHALGSPLLVLLVALAWLWRRRGLPRWLVRAAPAMLALVAFVPRAHAGGYQPYWENPDVTADENAAPDDPNLVKWNVGLKLGPYVPQIDAHFAAKPGPYEQMFGGYHMLVLVDVERVIWSGFGQVAVGASAGYWQKTARGYTIDSSAMDADRARATDVNKFRLVPTALTVAYRFTMLDDEYGIPVVPYVRGGLSYYLWWITTAAGSTAVACKDGSDTPGCDETKGLGASLGVQGAVGVAIRAERIDAAAANSMRQSGIQHAGIFAELSAAKVDGFGNEKKLSVGDRTWFAGVNFEF